MPIEYSSSGIITQNLLEILNERETYLKTTFGEDFVIDQTSPIGNMELADSNSEARIQELIAWLIPNQLDANTATGIFLDAICEKNRIYRKQPQYTKVNFILNGTVGKEFSSGDITVMDSISGVNYDLNADATIGEDGKVSVQFQCETFGEYYPLLTSTLVIQTPVVGLDSVTIDEDNPNLQIGRLTETDDELRVRRQYSVGQTATTTMESIYANLYSTDGVRFVKYFENYTESTDTHGLPMKSFEFIVDGGDKDEITDIIFLNKSIGSRAYGTVTVQKEDSQGNVYAIGYTPAEAVNIGIIINLEVSTVVSDVWKNNIKNAIKTKFDEIQGIGDDVKDYDYYVVLTSFSGIDDIDSVQFYNTEVDPPVLTDKFSIGEKAIAKLDISNIDIITDRD